MLPPGRIAKVSSYAYGTLRHGVRPGSGAIDAGNTEEVVIAVGTFSHPASFKQDGVKL